MESQCLFTLHRKSKIKWKGNFLFHCGRHVWAEWHVDPHSQSCGYLCNHSGSFLAGCSLSMMCIKEDIRHFVYKWVVFLKKEAEDCSLVERIDLKAFFFCWVLYKCILGSKGKKNRKMKEQNKNYQLLSCILISHCVESTSHLIKAHHVFKQEITT